MSDLKTRYDIYRSCANDGNGLDTTTGCKTKLKTFDQWLDNLPGDPAGTPDLLTETTPWGDQTLIPGTEQITWAESVQLVGEVIESYAQALKDEHKEIEGQRLLIAWQTIQRGV